MFARRSTCPRHALLLLGCSRLAPCPVRLQLDLSFHGLRIIPQDVAVTYGGRVASLVLTGNLLRHGSRAAASVCRNRPSRLARYSALRHRQGRNIHAFRKLTRLVLDYNALASLEEWPCVVTVRELSLQHNMFDDLPRLVAEVKKKFPLTVRLRVAHRI